MKKNDNWKPQPLKDNITLFTHDENTIAYKYYQKKDTKKTILFFYGFAGNIEYLREIGEHLGTEYSVIAVDYPGHGFSYKQKDFSLDVFIDTVIALLDSLNEKRIHLFGYSFGGVVALLFYKKKKEMIEKLILLNCEFNFSYNFVKKLFYNIFLSILKIGLKFSVVTVAIPILKDKYLTDEHYRDSKEVILYNNHQSVMDFYKSVVFTNYEYLLNEIQCPVLLIGSKIDFLIAEKRTWRLQSLIKNSEIFIMNDVGHLSVVTKSLPIAEKSIVFLRK